jgi:hypothetical protein
MKLTMNHTDENKDRKASTGRGRPSEEKPYCWQSRRALDCILESQDMNHAPFTLAIYGALTNLASRNGNSQFTATQRAIMQLAGIGSDNTLRKHLSDLCEMRLLKIDVNHYADGGIAPSTYTLLSAGPTSIIAGATSIRVRRKEKKSLKEKKKHGTSSRTRNGKPSRVLSLSLSGYTEEEVAIITGYHDIVVAVDPRWLRITKFTEQVREAIKEFLAEFRDRDLDDVLQLFHAAAERDERVTIPGRRTLVRLLRSNLDIELPNLDTYEEEIPF